MGSISVKISSDIKFDFDDVLIRPQRSTLISRADVILEREFQFYHSPRIWQGIPIVCSNMAAIAGFEMATALAKHKMVTCLHKYISTDDLINFFVEHKDLVDYVWVSVGYGDDEIDKLIRITKEVGFQPNVCIDIANGHLECFVQYCADIRNDFPDSIIMAGNVCIPESTQELILHGYVDLIKIGTGGGSACLSRMVTGVGCPQLSALDICASAAHGLKSAEKRLGLVCSDGGCKTAGDVCKGFVAGADFLMLGGMLAGTKECCGEWTTEYKDVWGCWNEETHTDEELKKWRNIKSRKKSLKVYGMSSHLAQEKHGVGKKDYRASEGVVIEVPYKGSVDDVVQEILGGIRSCATYIGACSLKDFSKCGEFIRVCRQK